MTCATVIAVCAWYRANLVVKRMLLIQISVITGVYRSRHIFCHRAFVQSSRPRSIPMQGRMMVLQGVRMVSVTVIARLIGQGV